MNPVKKVYARATSFPSLGACLLLALIFGAAEVTAQVGPSITLQPQSQTNVVGSTAIFRVSATGTAPLSFRWRKNGTNLVNDARISGVTTTNLTIANVQTNDAGNYSAFVSNGVTTVTSLTAVLTVPVTNTYTVNVGVGLNLIANQVDRGGNTLNEVLPGVPTGSRLYKFNNASQTWQAAAFTTAWIPGTITLSPGEGAFLQSPSNLVLTFTGIRRTPVLPLNIPSGFCFLLSRQTPDIGTFDTITGLTPRDGNTVHKWNRTTATYNTFLFNAAGVWQPSAPTTAIGEAAWICPQGGSIPNAPPTISDILNQSTGEDITINSVPFTIADLETPTPNLFLFATSTNTTLVPVTGISFGGGTGNSRTLSITPALNQSGTTLITVTVRDGNNLTASDSFLVTVSALNDPPTISNIPDQTIVENGSTGEIPFTVGDVETAAGSLLPSASSSNPILVPVGNISFGGGGSNRTVTVTPAPNQTGTNVVTVTITDALGASTNDTFRVIVNPAPPVIVSIDALCQRSNLIVGFSKPVDPVTSLNTSRYVVTALRGTVPVSSVELGPDPRILTLHLSGPLTPQVLYTLTATVNGTTGGTGVSTDSFNCNPCLRGSAGKEFWVTFPGNYSINPIDDALPLLLIAGEPGTTGTVSVAGLSLPFTDTFLIPEEGTTGLLLPQEADLGDANDVIQNKGVHITSDKPVTIYGVNFMPYSTEGYLALPLPALGRAYVVMTYQNLSIGAPDLNGVQLGVVATDDSTTVTIVPSALVAGHPAGVPFTRTLQRGQTFQLLNAAATPVDLTGTLVFADKPIAVFGSHQCASVPSTNDVFLCNHIIEQMPPTQMWGTEFLTMPLAGRSGGDTFRFMALSGGATVTVNGVSIPGVLNSGQFHEVRLNQPAHIVANRPILAAQFANSSDFDSATNSDPFMVLVPPTRLFASEYTVPIGFPNSFVNIVAPSGTTVLLNGNPVLIDSPIGASGYSGATMPFESSALSVASVDGAPFGLIVYGWELFDSYAFPGGLCQTSDTAQPPSCVCPPSELSVPMDNNCNLLVPDMRPYLGDCYLFVTQTPAAGQVVRSSTGIVTTTAYDLLGNRTDCVTTITGGLSDIVTNCVTPAGTRVEYSVLSCGTTLTCNPPPGSLFPPGVTTVNCVGPLQTGGSFEVTVRCLSIAFEAPDTVIVTWTGGGALETAPSLTGPWDLVDAASPFPLTVKEDEQRFFRIQYGK